MIDSLCETLKELGERKAAITLLEALGRHAVGYEQYDSLAMCYFKIKRYNESVYWAEKTLAFSTTNEQRFNSRLNLVNAYAHAFHPEKALNEIALLETMSPNDIDIWGKKAFCLYLIGERTEAEIILKKIIADPRADEETKNKVEFNLGTYELFKDNFKEGLYRFLHFGRKMNLWKKPQLPFDPWDGTLFPGHTLIIRAEAGIGDEFINVRFMNHVKKLGMNPIWFTERADMNVIFNNNGYTTVDSLEKINVNPITTHWCHSMDLPVLLNLKYEDLWNGSYIKAVDQPTPILKSNKLKIGIRWQGNPDYDNDLHRSVPLSQLWEILKEIDADFYSLQRDDGIDEVYDYPQIVPLHEKHLNSFSETLSIIDDLDIVVTSCTSIAHAAAALGKKTFVFTPMSSYYVWCFSERQPRSPWYGENVTLLRQKRPRYWDEPLNELKQCLIGL